MAEYSFTPQFANLAGIQPLPAIDVTRGGALQFQPLQAIEVPSARPELVGAGIASAIERIGSGVLSGITAKYEEKKEAEREQLEHERQLELYGAKKRSENQEFYERERARFIATEGSKPGFKKKLEAFDSAMEGFKSRTPDVKPIKEEEEEAPLSNEIVEPELPEKPLTADFVTVPEEIPQARPGVFGFSILEEKKKPLAEMQPPATPTVVEETAPLAPLAPPRAEEKPATAVDYTEYPQPPAPSQQFETDAEAQNVAAELNNQLRGVNPDYRYEVIGLGKPDEWKTVVPVSIRDERIKREETSVSAAKQEARETRSEKIEQEKLDIAKAKEAREKAESEQQMQIRQQKVKDENKILAGHVETAATSLKELNDIISIVEKNPLAVGKMSALIAGVPGVDTDASRVRAKLETIQSNVAINAVTAMRQASPTGAAVGNTSDKEMGLFKATEGTIDPDKSTAKDILPVLKDIYRKRLDIYNNSANILKQNNPEYTPPAIEYPKETKRKSASKVTNEMVSVVSPDGKSGRIPKSQLEQAIAEGYKLKQ